MNVPHAPTIRSRPPRLAAATAAALLAPALFAQPAAAEVFTSHGLTFVTVRDAGNRGATVAEAPLWPTWAPPLGAVDHDYGIMRTNVTNTEWVEFVRAYGQHWTGIPSDTNLTGLGVRYTGTVGGVRQYAVASGQERYSADMTWRIAARYCNWLHNGKSSEAWAFENGAYDTSTFGQTTVGGITQFTDQFTHHPDARFWIPTAHEYTKGAHWDPDKFGPGQGGYWLMPDGGDERLIAGPPGVGEAAGDWWPGTLGFIDVELYPDTQSPWGMLDVSSTYAQFTEGWMHPAAGVMRVTRGSAAGSVFYWNTDRIDNFTGGSTTIANNSLRIATVIPGISSLVTLGVGAITLSHRRRRRVE